MTFTGYTGSGKKAVKELEVIGQNSNSIELRAKSGALYIYIKPAKALRLLNFGQGKLILSDCKIS